MPDTENLTDLLAEYADDEAGQLAGEGDLAEISALANQQLKLDDDIQKAELMVTVLKEKQREISQEKLPDAMEAAGMKEFTLTDGSKIKVSDQRQTSIKGDKKPEALVWLNDNGHGSIIKHNVTCTFGRGEDDEAKKLTEVLESEGFEYNDVEDVHYQTLQAWGRKQVEEGVEPPADLFNTFDVTIAKITAPKK